MDQLRLRICEMESNQQILPNTVFLQQCHQWNPLAFPQGTPEQPSRRLTEPPFPADPLLANPAGPKLAARLSAHSALPGLLVRTRGNKGLPRECPATNHS